MPYCRAQSKIPERVNLIQYITVTGMTAGFEINAAGLLKIGSFFIINDKYENLLCFDLLKPTGNFTYHKV
jgi:hypothetical protein